MVAGLSQVALNRHFPREPDRKMSDEHRPLSQPFRTIYQPGPNLLPSAGTTSCQSERLKGGSP
jgi:hypothetical protein